jgi:hypothetical protein
MCADRLRPFINGLCLAPGVPVVRMSNYCDDCHCYWTLSCGVPCPASLTVLTRPAYGYRCGWPACVGRQLGQLTLPSWKTPRHRAPDWVRAPSMNRFVLTRKMLGNGEFESRFNERQIGPVMMTPPAAGSWPAWTRRARNPPRRQRVAIVAPHRAPPHPPVAYI